MNRKSKRNRNTETERERDIERDKGDGKNKKKKKTRKQGQRGVRDGGSGDCFRSHDYFIATRTVGNALTQVSMGHYTNYLLITTPQAETIPTGQDDGVGGDFLAIGAPQRLGTDGGCWVGSIIGVKCDLSWVDSRSAH